jgi:hypothetical protein
MLAKFSDTFGAVKYSGKLFTLLFTFVYSEIFFNLQGKGIDA